MNGRFVAAREEQANGAQERQQRATALDIELVTLLLGASPLRLVLVNGDGELIAANDGGLELVGDDASDLATRFVDGSVVDDANGPFRISRREILTSSGGRYTLIAALSDAIDACEVFANAVAHWSLTPRQREVLRGILDGMSNKEIAKLSGCSFRTVEIHVTALLMKAGVDTRARLVARARALAKRAQPDREIRARPASLSRERGWAVPPVDTARYEP